ncbi:MAG: Hsp33 family molecular chaperone HslO [Defluviitaleaceae bacterium]|nr:Hsp33 family molecular chaperone HslO [Defluviitaleaceae bacterium]
MFIANTRNIVNDAFAIHKTSPVVTAAFGRTLTAAAIMGAMLKNETDLLTITIKCDGPIGGIVATVNNRSQVKGYVHNNIVEIPTKPTGKLDVSGAIGKGTLTVTKDISLKEPVSGQTPLVSGEIAEDITHYYAKSEQIPSCVALGVLVDRDYTVLAAGGFIAQLLPGAKEEIISHLESVLSTLPPVTTMLTTGKDILTTLFPHHKINDHGSIEPAYYCNCTRGKTQKALISVGEEELQTILKEDGEAKIHCHFCKSNYLFNRADIEGLLCKTDLKKYTHKPKVI